MLGVAYGEITEFERSIKGTYLVVDYTLYIATTCNFNTNLFINHHKSYRLKPVNYTLLITDIKIVEQYSKHIEFYALI